MEEVVLKAEKRDIVRKRVNALRRSGKLPAILYGRELDGPMPVMLDTREASKILNNLATSAIVTVEVDGKRYPALVREKQRDILLGSFRHIDFQVISMKQRLRVDVALEFTGEAPALESSTGILVYGMENVPVEAVASDLPESIQVDITSLKEIGDAIYVRDLTVPEGVTFLIDHEEMVVQVNAPAAVAEEEEEEEVVEEFEAEEPEVIERGKREEEEEE